MLGILWRILLHTLEKTSAGVISHLPYREGGTDAGV